mmetsp:Transcript_19997/g.35177  ORF Transcript_19997/g.35177 Transcript_19997/m.35177 type:complete len:476 (-) Transcript_19997:845-2272(-)
MATKGRTLADGSQGVTHCLPPGDLVSCDSSGDVGLTVHDIPGRLQWSFKFFENLHMDLNEAGFDHLIAGVERLGRSLFEEHFRVSSAGSYYSAVEIPKTKEDPAWSPVVDVKYVQVDTDQPKTTTKGLVVIHRLAYREGEEIVMGRFLLPVRRGLYEVIVIAGDGGGMGRGSSEPTADEQLVPDPEELSIPIGIATSPSSTGSIATATTATSTINTRPTANEKKMPSVRTFDMDSPEYDEQFPNHCLSRVRRAIHWLIHKSSMTVSELPRDMPPAGTEIDLSHLRCRIIPPTRFVYCPNPYNPESNKYRFCRATLGGTDGVEMMVVSAWYTERDIGKGFKPLRKVAMHAARVIHQSQQLFHIRIETKEVNLQSKNDRKWLVMPGAKRNSGKDAVITVVNCNDAQGTRKQNTIGFIRESKTGQVYLVYFADTIAMDKETVMREIMDTLSSIRVPSLISKRVQRKLAWHATPVPMES